MCRLLYIRSKDKFDIANYLRPFSQIARNSKEYQGHGWGCSYWSENRWQHYKNIKPIWQDDLAKFGQCHLLIAHARSAFRDQGITVEHNMPFHDDRHIFVFNGELRGVRLKAQGRIGAEKIFNFIRRLDRGDMLEALRKAVGILEKRSQYIRAVNIILARQDTVYLASQFNEDAEYFTMHIKRTGRELIICSEQFPGDTGWSPIANHTIEAF